MGGRALSSGLGGILRTDTKPSLPSLSVTSEAALVRFTGLVFDLNHSLH